MKTRIMCNGSVRTAMSHVHWTISRYNLSLKVVFLFQSFLVITVDTVNSHNLSLKTYCMFNVVKRYSCESDNLQSLEVMSTTLHGGLSQCGPSNRPRIRPGTVKSLNAPWDVVSPPTGLCQEIWPLSYVSLVRATSCTIGSGQYTLLSGRPVQTGQVLFEFKFTTAQSDWIYSY